MTVDGAPLTVRRELARKSLHMLWAIVPIAYSLGVSRDVILAGLLIACATAIVIEIARARSLPARALFDRTTGALLREHEKDGWSGATWLLLSFLIVILLFDAPVAIAATWAVAIGDAIAAIIGRTVGRRHIGRSLKTIEGSVACALATGAGAWLLAHLEPAACVTAGVAAAAAEWPARPFDDNVRIGLAVGIGILLSRMVFS